MGGIIDVRHNENINKILRAREEAFSAKYGSYDYETDLRANYKDSWHEVLQELLKNSKKDADKKLKVIGMASNTGVELKQIFSKHKNVDLSVLDLSEVAIKKGKELYPDVSFYKGNMEECTLPKAEFDVYLNLRSIHSSGVDIRATLSECTRLLKSNGLAIISVSNGYLTPNPVRESELLETVGMYDNRINAFSIDKPYELSNKIRMKLDYYGFHSIEIHTGPTEIFVKAIK